MKQIKEPKNNVVSFTDRKTENDVEWSLLKIIFGKELGLIGQKEAPRHHGTVISLH